MEKKVRRFIKVYPWFHGLTADLLFYIAIDTLFLATVKNLTAAEIVSLTTISSVASLVLRFPVLWIMERVGNNLSIKLTALLMLISALLITFGGNFYIIALGKIFHNISVLFSNSLVLALGNNLELIDKSNDFVKVRTSGNTVYSSVTMVIAFIASYMFNLNNYLPMIGCITTCLIGFILSFFLEDCSKFNKTVKKKTDKKSKVHFSKVIFWGMFVYAIFVPVVNSGQTEGKLFTQQELLTEFSIETTSIIIGAIICISRVARVLSNIVFSRIYSGYNSKTGIVLASMLASSIGMTFFGSFIGYTPIKIGLMGFAYIIILFVRDPFRLYVQDVIIGTTAKEYHRSLLVMMGFYSQIGTLVLNATFTVVLLGYTLRTVMGLLFIISVICVLITIKFYKTVIEAINAKKAETV